MGGPPDDFPQVASRQHIDSFKEYIRSLIIPLDTPPISPGKLAAANKLRYFLTWLSSSRRPLFTENNWLDTVSMEYIILSTPSHFTYMAADANRSTPSIPGSWTYYQWDSSLPRMRDFSLTYSQLEAVILRDNFGSFTPHHFFPLPSSPDPRRDLDSALCSLVKNLIANFTAASPPRNLATYYRRGDNGICVPAPRAYHPHAPLSEDASPSPPIPTVSFSSCLGDSSVSTSPSVSSSSPELAESTLSSADPFITDFLSPPSVDVSLDQWVSDYTRIPVPGDGDCFFSAVNFIMRRLDGNWTHDNSSLRQLSLTQLEQDVSAFYLPCIPMPGINSNLPQIWSSTKAKYQYSGQYADHDLMMALAKALNIDIQIHGGATSLLQVDGRTPLLTIHLLYSGLQADKNGGNHYDPLFPNESQIITPPEPSSTSASLSTRASPWSLGPLLSSKTHKKPRTSAKVSPPLSLSSTIPAYFPPDSLVTQLPSSLIVTPLAPSPPRPPPPISLPLDAASSRYPWVHPQWPHSSFSPSSLFPHLGNRKKAKKIKGSCSSSTLPSSLSSTLCDSPPSVTPLRPPPPRHRKTKRNVDLSSWENNFQDNLVLLSNPDCLGATTHVPVSFPDLNVCTLNTNSLTDSKYIAILALTQHLAIDVFILTDTRHLDSSTRFLTSQAKLLLGPHTKVLHSPTQSLRVGKKAKTTPNVGGQIIIVTSKWAGAVSHHYSDPTNLGLVSSVTLSTGSGKLLIFGTYWPYPSDSSTSNGLWNKTSAYLLKNKIRKTPRDFIQDILCRKSEKHLGVSLYNLSAVCGDFNHS